MTQQPKGSAPDPIGDFQRWLLRSSARGMSRELGGHLAGAFGMGGRSGDVWESATAPPPQEAPECAWCPVCRAARLLRGSGPGLASHVTTAGDVLSSLVQEASAMVESVLSAAGRRAAGGESGGTGHGEPGSEWGEAAAEWDDPAALWEDELSAQRDASATVRDGSAAARDEPPAQRDVPATEQDHPGSEWDLATRANGKDPGPGSAPGSGSAQPRD